MTHAQTIAKQTAALNDAEVQSFTAALSNNATPLALFDAIDIKRLAAYRRAVRAGLYNEGLDEPGSHADITLTDIVPAATPAAHTHPTWINGRRQDMPCSKAHA